MGLRVLVACEYSGRVRDAFIRRGHDAISCDLLPTEQPGPHIQGDVRPLLRERWDVVIAHPPCTYLCNSGVRWLYTETGTLNLPRWESMREAVDFFLICLNANAPCVAVENPVMHKHARDRLHQYGVEGPSFTVQPWQFGDNEKKRTCFWTRGLFHLHPTSKLDGSTAAQSVHKAPPGPDRWKDRSRTFHGIAEALAEQYGAADLLTLMEVAE
jgi:hypothetical protein